MESKDNVEKEKSKKIKLKDYLIKIKSKYILKQIFKHLRKNILLQTIKYNKNIQKKLDFTFKDFKEFSQKYSKIELEIIPAENKYGKFINIINESDENFFHLYFNNNKKRTKCNKLKEINKVKKIKIKIEYPIKSFKELFKNCKCIESITFNKFSRNNITDMSYMFDGCESLKELNFDNFNTENVTDMNHMFDSCFLLEELNLSKFNTQNVSDMGFMFYGCLSLNKLNINNFNTQNVDNMNFMFDRCSSLQELNLSNFNTVNVSCMIGMFSNCSSLKELNISNFEANNSTNIKDIFSGCCSLDKLMLPPGFTNLRDLKLPKITKLNN